MKKILLISYYGLKDSLLCASQSLEKLGYTIDTYPLFQYAYDTHDKKENYKEHFNAYIQDTSPDIILWWFMYVPSDVIQYITTNNQMCYSILFCWDDPFVWTDKTTKLSEKCPYFDLAIATCEETLEEYKKHGTKEAMFSVPGYDPNINYPFNDEKYDCDVSICCTNLYEDLSVYGDQYMNRKELIDILVKEPDIKFHIYGPEFLKYKYPDNYKGFIQYSELNEIYNRSKINICTHVCSSKSKYVNERTVLILGSGGLLMVDPVKDMNKIITNEECVFIQKDKVINQIKEILMNYDKYKEVKHKGHLKSLQYTWDKWAEKIHKKISMYFFNNEFYQKLYNIPENIVNLREYWEREGIKYGHIPFKFDVPKSFDYPQYSINNKLIEKKKEYIYWHYRLNSRSQRYILQFENKKKFDIKKIMDECKIDPGCWFELNNKFKSISKGENVECNLQGLETINVQYPYIDINKLLSLYFDIVEK